MGVVDLMCRLFCNPCSTGPSVKDAVWRSVASTTRSESTSQQQSESKDVESSSNGGWAQAIRKRWASSPKSNSIQSPQKIPNIFDTHEPDEPEMSSSSEILSTVQVSTIFQSLSPIMKFHPWALLFSTSSDGCSLKHLYRRLTSFECALLLVIEVQPYSR